MLHISEAMSSSAIRDRKDAAAELHLPQLFCTHIHISQQPGAQPGGRTRGALTLSVVLSEASVLPTPLRHENCVRSEGDKCWTNLWTLSRGRGWTVEFQVRRHCFLASPVLTDPTAFLSHFGYCALGEEEASFYITMLYVNLFLVCNGSLRHLLKTSP